MTGRQPYHLGQQTEMNLNPTPAIACGISPSYDFLPALLKRANVSSHALGKCECQREQPRASRR